MIISVQKIMPEPYAPKVGSLAMRRYGIQLHCTKLLSLHLWLCKACCRVDLYPWIPVFAFYHFRNRASSKQLLAASHMSGSLNDLYLFGHSFCFLLKFWMAMLGPCPFCIYWIKKDNGVHCTSGLFTNLSSEPSWSRWQLWRIIQTVSI